MYSAAELLTCQERLARCEALLAQRPHQTENHYVPVVSNEGEEALREAIRREAAVNPDVASVLSRIEHTADQLRAGMKAARNIRT